MSAGTHLLHRGPCRGQLELSHTTEPRQVMGVLLSDLPNRNVTLRGTFPRVVRFPSQGAGKGGVAIYNLEELRTLYSRTGASLRSSACSIVYIGILVSQNPISHVVLHSGDMYH